MEPIHASAENPENTLDFWAGYAVNPEDRARLEAAIKNLGRKAPLLKEVGSFRSADAKVGIFDLGGNVAEWASFPGRSTAKARCSAAAPMWPPENASSATPAQAYIGFRVVSSK